jgi:RNA polymerase sigma-70 factor (ECF subfamily)
MGMTTLLNDKQRIIYGAGGGLGRGFAATFSREGATVHLVGRSAAPLETAAPGDEEPDAVVVARETIELAYLATIQLLPAKQRAVLILRDILGWSADETATALDMTVAAANSALQRARATLRSRLPATRTDWSATEVTAKERELLSRFIDTHERQDAKAAVAMLREDIRVTMPPHPFRYDGLVAVAGLMARALGAESIGDWRLVETQANRIPAAASYLRAHGDDTYRAFKFDVLRIEDGLIVEITTFGAELFEVFGLPAITS